MTSTIGTMARWGFPTLLLVALWVGPAGCEDAETPRSFRPPPTLSLDGSTASIGPEGGIASFMVEGKGVSKLTLELYMAEDGELRRLSKAAYTFDDEWPELDGMVGVLAQPGDPFDQPGRLAFSTFAGLSSSHTREVTEAGPILYPRKVDDQGGTARTFGRIVPEEETVIWGRYYWLGGAEGGRGTRLDTLADAKAFSARHPAAVAVLTLRWE